jgi:hypothetical protein
MTGKRYLGLAAAGLLASACSPAQDMSTVQADIASFHGQLNAAQFQPIYDRAAADMKSASSQRDFTKFLAAVHRKLGNFQSGQISSWNDSLTQQGHVVTIGYAAKYDQGPAQESFVYRIEGERAQLAGYHVNSMALIEN